jgi:hypothetical protein
MEDDDFTDPRRDYFRMAPSEGAKVQIADRAGRIATELKMNQTPSIGHLDVLATNSDQFVATHDVAGAQSRHGDSLSPLLQKGFDGIDRVSPQLFGDEMADLRKD